MNQNVLNELLKKTNKHKQNTIIQIDNNISETNTDISETNTDISKTNTDISKTNISKTNTLNNSIPKSISFNSKSISNINQFKIKYYKIIIPITIITIIIFAINNYFLIKYTNINFN